MGQTMSELKRSKDLTKSNLAIKARRALDIASELASDVIHMRDAPRVTDFIALGAKLAQRVVSKMEGEIYDYFDDWYHIGDITFKDELMDAVKHFKVEQVGGRDDYAIMVADVYGEEVGWVRTSPESPVEGRKTSPSYEGPWINFERYDETFNALGRALWEHLDTSKVLLGATTKMRYDHAEQNVKLMPDMDIVCGAHVSSRGVEVYDRIRKFYDAGVNRSIVFLGPPGTGKTTIMKYIASRFDRHTMRINVSELADISPTSMVAAVQLLKPEVLLIDDFDGFSKNSNKLILTQLEQVNKAVKVFIVSVNDISEIDPAVIRPGRFDEIIEIDRIDDVVLDNMVAGMPAGVRDILKSWPVAYIEEFAKRYRCVGAAEALREISQLKHRIEKINNSRYKGFEFDEVAPTSEVEVDEDYIEQLVQQLEREGDGR